MAFDCRSIVPPDHSSAKSMVMFCRKPKIAKVEFFLVFGVKMIDCEDGVRRNIFFLLMFDCVREDRTSLIRVLFIVVVLAKVGGGGGLVM